MPTYPSTELARVSSFIHRYDRRAGIYQIEASLGGTTSVFVLPYESAAKRSTAEQQQEQDFVPVAEEAADEAVKSIGGAMLTSYAKNVLKKAGLYYPMMAARRAREPGALTARALEVMEEREQEFQKLEEQVAKARMAAGGVMPVTERTRRIIRESPGAQLRLEELRRKRWKFGDWFKLWR